MSLVRSIAALGVLLCLSGDAAPGQDTRTAEDAPEIDWQPWSAETFKHAAEVLKPVLVNVRAHWYRASIWMDEVVYSDPEVRRLIQKNWIAVEVDRDRRPDIDLRYQVAVEVVNRDNSGWPLTLFLFDTGDLIYGGSIFHVEDRRDTPGLVTLLAKGKSYTQTRQEPIKTRHLTARVFQEEKEIVNQSDISWTTLESIGRSMVESLDVSWGGFQGDRHLYPYSMELAGTLYHRTGDERMLDVLVRTLRGLEKGGIHDRLGGGFHRYALDRAWRLPTFEKPLNYNAPLLEGFLIGYEATGDPDLRSAAEGIARFLLGNLQSEEGGFYVGQWALGSIDEPIGGYYTWDAKEFEKLVPGNHAELAGTLFGITEEGELRLGPPPRDTLFLASTREEASAKLGVTLDQVREGEREILEALRAAREKRTSPPIEKAIYVDSCAAAVTALLEVHRVLGLTEARDAALRALDRLLAAIPQGSPLLHRVEPPPERGYDPALALDHLMLARASIAGYEATGEGRYLSSARNLIDRAVVLFWDPDDVGFFDVVEDKAAVGYLSIRRHLASDKAFPALNALASRVLERLYYLTGESVYRERSIKCLKGLIATNRSLSFHDGGLGLALEGHLTPPTKYYVVGKKGDEGADRLQAAARGLFDPGKVVVRLVPGIDDPEIERLEAGARGEAYAVVCRPGKCSEPVTGEEGLRSHARTLLGSLALR